MEMIKDAAGEFRRISNEGFFMRYADGNEARAGDLVKIDARYRGRVIACMDLNEYLPGKESWAYLREGIMVDTDFAGLVHYTADAADKLVLLERAVPS